MSGYPLGAFAEARGFTCPACRRIGGRRGVDGDEWTVTDNGELICAACAQRTGSVTA